MLIFADAPPNGSHSIQPSVQYELRYSLVSAQALAVVDEIEVVRLALAHAAAGAVSSSAAPVVSTPRAQAPLEFDIGDGILDFEPPLAFDSVVRIKVRAFDFTPPPFDFD